MNGEFVELLRSRLAVLKLGKALLGGMPTPEPWWKRALGSLRWWAWGRWRKSGEAGD